MLLTRALPSALAVPLHRKLAWAKTSASAISHLPLAAMAAQFKVLAALACPGDSEACGGVCKGDKVFEAAALALALPRSPSHPPHVSAAINDLRVAAATLLANLATRKGSDSAWSARPALLTQCFGALRDECVGVRAASAACIAALVRNSVRLRVTPGIEEAVRGALSDNTALLASAKGRGVAHLAAHFNTLRGDPPTAAHPLSVEEAAEEARQVKNAAGILETAVRCCGEALSSLLHHG